MNLSEALKITNEITIWIHGKTNEIQVANEQRIVVSLAVFQQAMDVADGMVILIENKLPGPAWALARALHESYVRGVWLLDHADANQLENFVKGICPKISKLVKLIRDAQESGGAWIRGINDLNITSLHSLAHGGMEHVSRRIETGSIEPGYSEEETVNFLKLRNQYYVNIGVFILAIIQDEAALIELNNKTGEWKKAL
ncbi:MAG TPA: hypothetical protein ENI99_11890 [Sedimenticola sp.]|nr:hypothetical protein [Sedimenticola sp.]